MGRLPVHVRVIGHVCSRDMLCLFGIKHILKLKNNKCKIMDVQNRKKSCWNKWIV